MDNDVQMNDTAQKETGTISWFNTQKGYGFIGPDKGGNDVFVHITDLQCDPNDLREGVKVEYTVTKGAKGLQASQVALAKAE